MKWYVSIQGQTQGPIEERDLAELVKRGGLEQAFVRDEAASGWTPIAGSPFAPLLGAVRSPAGGVYGVGGAPLAGSVQARPAVASKAETDPGLKLALWVFGLLIFAAAAGWFGLLVGLGFIAWGELSRRSGRRSFTDWVLKRAPSKGLSIATMSLGLAVSLCSAARISGDYKKESDAQAAVAQAEVSAKQTAEAAAKRRSELEAALPSKLKDWRIQLAAAQAATTAQPFDPKRLDEISATAKTVTAFANDLGAPYPDALAAFANDASATLEKLNARAEFEAAIRSIDSNLANAQGLVTTKEWLQADTAYENALNAASTVDGADDGLKRLLPGGTDLDAKKREIENLRARIAAPVAGARAVAEHERRLQKISTVQSNLQPGNRESYSTAVAELQAEIAACGRCKTAAELKKVAAAIEAELANWPVDLGSIQEMMTRYADLRGRKVRIKGRLSAATYYNCRFASQGQWRGFRLSDSIVGGVHVYCSRGDEGCESIFNRLAAGGAESGTAVVEYPQSNSVCEEDQAYLRGWI